MSLAVTHEAALQGSFQVALISGPPGIGKTELVMSFAKRLPSSQSLFVFGKYDPLRVRVPYQALCQAIRQIVRHLLSQDETTLQRSRAMVMAVLGRHAAVMLELVPELEILLGSQPPATDLTTTDAQLRFRQVLFAFLGLFGRADRPLILFLDDLQWADAASLRILEHWTTKERPAHILLLGAYRDEDLSENAAFADWLRALRRCNPPTEIALGPLAPDAVRGILEDAFPMPPEYLQPLVELFAHKTLGTPLLIHQLLGIFSRSGVLSCDNASNTWRWDRKAAEALPVTDELADILRQSLGGLPVQTLHILGAGACIGQRFSAGSLSEVTSIALEQVVEAIGQCQNWLLLRPVADGAMEAECGWEFAHDRIRQEAQNALEPSLQREIHAIAGRTLLAQVDGQRYQNTLFLIADHLNAAGDRISFHVPWRIISKVNLDAGLKAKLSMAMEAAHSYFEAGLKALPEDAHTLDRPLVFALQREHAGTTFLLHGPKAAEPLIEACRALASDVIEEAALFSFKAYLHLALMDLPAVCTASMQGLALLGVTFPEQERQHWIAEQHREVASVILERPLEVLAAEPLVDDPRLAAIMDLMATLSFSFWFDRELHAMCIVQAVRIMLHQGQVPNGIPGYAAYGSIFAATLKDFSKGYGFGQLALALAKRTKIPIITCHVQEIVGTYHLSIKSHPRESLGLVRESFTSAVEYGQYSQACVIGWSIVAIAFTKGDPLPMIQSELDRLLELATRWNLPHTRLLLASYDIVLKNMASSSAGFTAFVNDEIDSHAVENIFRNSAQSYPLMMFNIFRVWALFLHRRLDEALNVCREQESLLAAYVSPMLLYSAENDFIQGLIYCEALHRQQPPDAVELWSKLQQNIEQLRLYAEHNPQAFGCRLALLEAEAAHCQDWPLEAMDLYDLAIQLARDNEFIQIKALAEELAGRFWLKRSKPHIGQNYLAQAYAHYAQWGARQKLALLEQEFPGLHALSRNTGGPSEPLPDTLELWKAIHAAQAISSEMQLDTLLGRLAMSLLELGRAERVCLVFRRKHEFRVKMEARAMHEPRRLDSPLDAFTDVPRSIIRYVARAGEPLLLNDAQASIEYRQEEYMRTSGVLSILCLPFVRQGKVDGVAYLEHRRFTNVFSHVPLAPLELLCAQATISLENARLYRDLSDQVLQTSAAEQDYRSIFENAQEGIFRSTEDRRILAANPAMARLLGYDSPVEMMSVPAEQGAIRYVQPEQRTDLFKMLSQGQTVTGFEVALHRKDGTIIEAELNARPIFGEDGALSHVEGMLIDMTQRKQAEQRVHALSQVLIKTQENERRALARDLHDDLAQTLSALKLSCERAILGHSSPQNVQAILKEQSHHLSAAIASVRSLSYGLHPPGLEQLGLRHCVVQYCEVFSSQTGIAVQVYSVGLDALALDANRSINLYRIIQEALGNILKHAQASEGIVRLSYSHPNIVLRIEDNGLGFDPRNAGALSGAGHGTGLLNIRERTALLGGTFQVHSVPGSGTRLTITVPHAETLHDPDS